MPERSSYTLNYTTQEAINNFAVWHPDLQNQSGIQPLAIIAEDLALVAPDAKVPETKDQAVAKMTKGALRMVLDAADLKDPSLQTGPHYVLDDEVHAESAEYFNQILAIFGKPVPAVIGAVAFGRLEVNRIDTLYTFDATHPKYGHLAGCTQIVDYRFKNV